MIKNKPDIIDVVQNCGIELSQTGRRFWACCPLHQENTPSFTVNPEKQVFYCFGCHEGGDVIAFIQKLRGLSFPDALKYLRIEGDKLWKPDPRELRKREIVKGFREWERRYRNYLLDGILTFNRLQFNSMNQVLECADLFHHQAEVEREIAILTEGTDQDKYNLFREVTGGF